MHVEVDRISDPARLAALAEGLTRVLADVRAAVTDWKPMKARLESIAADLDPPPPGVAPAAVAEAKAFLLWLSQDHFTLLGYRCHDLVVRNGEDALSLVPRIRSRRAARDARTRPPTASPRCRRARAPTHARRTS